MTDATLQGPHYTQKHVLALRPALQATQYAAHVDDGSESPALKVLELYLADGQGEGRWTGTPTVFVRLAGCTVGCDYCDTKYSWRSAGGEFISVHDLLPRIDAFGWSDIALTGGEPLEHPAATVLHFLETALQQSCGRRITIETSGTLLPAPWAAWNFKWAHIADEAGVLWSVAPKLPSAHARYAVSDETVEAWVDFTRATGTLLQFKWVCSTFEDIEQVVDIMSSPRISYARTIWNFIQPVTLAAEPDVIKGLLDRTRQMQDYVAKHKVLRLMARDGVLTQVRPQLHTLLHGTKRLV